MLGVYEWIYHVFFVYCIRTVDVSFLKIRQEIMWEEEMEQYWGEGLRNAGG